MSIDFFTVHTATFRILYVLLVLRRERILRWTSNLRNHPRQRFADQEQWTKHLASSGIAKERHRRIATEGALLGSVLEHGLSPELAIVSDDAGQFDILLHGLCWVHTERVVHKLIPLNEAHREDIARVRGQIWSLYADLKAYKANPGADAKAKLQNRFDARRQRSPAGTPAPSLVLQEYVQRLGVGDRKRTRARRVLPAAAPGY